VTRWVITLLGALVASFAAHAQEQMPSTATPNVPQIKPVRLKIVDPVASKYQFRLGDGEVDLMKAFSLDGSDGVGSAGRCRLLENSRNASGIGNGTVWSDTPVVKPCLPTAAHRHADLSSIVGTAMC
jgi:hypothetical protein